MPLARQETENLLRLIGVTQEHEINCDELLGQVNQFAEGQLQGEPISDELRTVQQHLAVCGECREEYELLLEALRDVNDTEDRR